MDVWDLIRNLLIFVLIVTVLSCVISIIRVNLIIRNVRGRKGEIFEKLLEILRRNGFNLISVDPIKSRIVIESMLRVNDIELYPIWAKRVVFALTDLQSEEIQIRAYAYRLILFEQYLRRSEQAMATNWRKIAAIVDELTSG